jgi:hypothetical protein
LPHTGGPALRSRTATEEDGTAPRTPPRKKERSSPSKQKKQVTIFGGGKSEKDVEGAPSRGDFVKDLICDDDEGFVQIERAGPTAFRYKVRLASGELDERTFDFLTEYGPRRGTLADTSQSLLPKLSPSSEEKKSRQRLDEKSLIADAVMKQSALLHGSVGEIELFPISHF